MPRYFISTKEGWGDKWEEKERKSNTKGNTAKCSYLNILISWSITSPRLTIWNGSWSKDSLPSCLCWHLIRLTFLHFIKTSLNILEFFCVRKAPGLNFQIHHIYHCLQNNWRINVNDWISSYNGQSTKAKMFTLSRKRHGKYIAPIQFLVKIIKSYILPV